MLVHLQNDKSICREHGRQCPNEFERQPYIIVGHHINHHTSNDKLRKVAQSRCSIQAIFAKIGLLRRGYVEYLPDFLQQLYDDIWYLTQRSSTRVLISIVDTLAGCPERYNTAILAASIFQEWLISISIHVSSETDKYLDSYIQHIPWPTISSVNAKIPDTPINYYRRILLNIRREPLIWILFFEIFQRIMATKNVPLVQLSKEIKKTSGIDILHNMTEMLRPTTISPKYMNLHAKKKNYGSGINKRYIKVLHEWGAMSVLNFGSGSSNNASISRLSVTDYEPTKGGLPRVSFDALVSFDVLEHIPENELPAICEWFKLWSKKFILGISTRSAGLILGNGENAHCTVRTADWWEKFFSEQFQDHEVRIERKIDDYVVLTCKNVIS